MKTGITTIGSLFVGTLLIGGQAGAAIVPATLNLTVSMSL